MKDTSILYFAWVREQLDRDSDTLTLTTPTAVTDIIKTLMTLSPTHRAVFENSIGLRCAVNHQLVELDHLAQPGDEIALFPPVTGG